VATVSRFDHGTVTGAVGSGLLMWKGMLVATVELTAMILAGGCAKLGGMETDSLPSRGIVLAATPLGNIGDASPRLKYALENADVIAAEDTRRTRNLATALGVEIRGKVVSNFDHNEDKRVAELIDAARRSTVLIVTDAGMPLVSDPGHSLVAAAHAAQIPVTCLPGPSAVTTALALSGLGVGQFIFDGFAPRKPGARKAWLQSLRNEKRAVCFFESPHRIETTLAEAARILGDRQAAVCRELTKTFEEVKRGTLAELAEWSKGGVKGEVTVVIDGGTDTAEPEDVLALVQQRVDDGMRAKDAVKEVAKSAGIKSGELYDAYIASRSS